jgi:hypothetical protein
MCFTASLNEYQVRQHRVFYQCNSFVKLPTQLEISQDCGSNIMFDYQPQASLQQLREWLVVQFLNPEINDTPHLIFLEDPNDTELLEQLGNAVI